MVIRYKSTGESSTGRGEASSSDVSDPRGKVPSSGHGDTVMDYDEGEVRQGTRNRMLTKLLNIGTHSSKRYEDLLSDDGLPFPSAEGNGRRWRRWWPRDRKWYTGTVGRYHSQMVPGKWYTVYYDDGEVRYEDRSKGRWREGEGSGEDSSQSSDGESDDGSGRSLPVDEEVDEEAEESGAAQEPPEESEPRAVETEEAAAVQASAVIRQERWGIERIAEGALIKQEQEPEAEAVPPPIGVPQQAVPPQTGVRLAAVPASPAETPQQKVGPPSGFCPTMPQKVGRIKAVLELDTALSLVNAIKAANELMGIAPAGARLPSQVDTLLAILGISDDRPAVKPAAAAAADSDDSIGVHQTVQATPVATGRAAVAEVGIHGEDAEGNEGAVATQWSDEEGPWDAAQWAAWEQGTGEEAAEEEAAASTRFKEPANKHLRFKQDDDELEEEDPPAASSAAAKRAAPPPPMPSPAKQPRHTPPPRPVQPVPLPQRDAPAPKASPKLEAAAAAVAPAPVRSKHKLALLKRETKDLQQKLTAALAEISAMEAKEEASEELTNYKIKAAVAEAFQKGCKFALDMTKPAKTKRAKTKRAN